MADTFPHTNQIKTFFLSRYEFNLIFLQLIVSPVTACWAPVVSALRPTRRWHPVTNAFPRLFFSHQTVTGPACAITVYADSEVIVQNGTTAVLRCTFDSSEVVTKATSVSWSFQSNQPDSQYYSAPYVVSPSCCCCLCPFWNISHNPKMFSCHCAIGPDTLIKASTVPQGWMWWFGVRLWF